MPSEPVEVNSTAKFKLAPRACTRPHSGLFYCGMDDGFGFGISVVHDSETLVKQQQTTLTLTMPLILQSICSRPKFQTKHNATEGGLLKTKVKLRSQGKVNLLNY